LPKLPRLTGIELAKIVEKFGFEHSHTTGSNIDSILHIIIRLAYAGIIKDFNNSKSRLFQNFLRDFLVSANCN